MSRKSMRRLLLVVGLLLLLLSSTLTIVRARGESEAYFLAVAQRDVQVNLYRYNVHGQRQLLFAYPTYNPVDLSWSPNGRSILLTFFQNYDGQGARLYVIDVAGTGARKIFQSTDISARAQWSPDGKTIAVFSTEPEQAGVLLHLINARNGEMLNQFSLTQARYVGWLGWETERFLKFVYLDHDNNSYSIRFDTSTGTSENAPIEPRLQGIVSPDGQWLISLEKDGSEYILVRSRLDGSERLVLTEKDLSPAWADWSPDSQWITFTNLNAARPSAIYRVSLTGDHLSKLTDNGRNNSTTLPQAVMFQAWAPNGKWRVYYSRDPGNLLWSAYLISEDGKEETYLLDIPYEMRAEWSPPVDLSWHSLALMGISLACIGTSRLLKRTSISPA